MNKEIIKIENIEVFGWNAAIRGMRNPKNSWNRSDSDFSNINNPKIGENDLKLAKALINGGPEHRKFLRMIHVQADFILPYYLVQEFDTYKIGTTRNSCSFMHKGVSKNFSEDDFVFDENDFSTIRKELLNELNLLRSKYLETNDMKYFRYIRQLLPAGYKVRFTWDGNYEILMNIYYQRKFHRLKEWHEICAWIETLPYMKEFLVEAGNHLQ